MAGRMLSVDEIMAILPETPRRIAALTKSLTPTQLHASAVPDDWSVNDRPTMILLSGAAYRTARAGGPGSPARS